MRIHRDIDTQNNNNNCNEKVQAMNQHQNQQQNPTSNAILRDGMASHYQLFNGINFLEIIRS